VIRRMAIVSGLMIMGACYLVLASRSEITPIRRPLSELPAQIGIWTEKGSTEFNKETLETLGVDDYINRIYKNPEEALIGLYVGYYVSQRQGDTIHSPLNCLPGAGWNPIRKETVAIPVQLLSTPMPANGFQNSEIRVNRIIVQKGLGKQVVIYWYQSHGRVIASEYWGKIYTVVDAMRTNQTDAALIRVVASVKSIEESAEREAEQNATDFIKSVFPFLSQHFPN
jgi:EpsI family protein